MTDAQILGVVFLATLVVLAIVLAILRRRNNWLLENGRRTMGAVLDTQYRTNSEGGGAWWSLVRFADGDGVEREKWLGGRYDGDVEVVHHRTKWKRATIAGGTVIGTRPGWVGKVAVVVLGSMFLGVLGSGILLSTGLWAPRIGNPDIGAICAGSGSGQHADHTLADAPHQVVGFDVEADRVVGIGLAEGLAWEARQEPWDARLVLCLERTDRTFVHTCRYGRAADERMVTLYDSEYAMTLRSAHTAATLDEGSWTSSIGSRCPFVVQFSEDDPNPKPRYSTDLPGITRFLRPYVEG